MKLLILTFLYTFLNFGSEPKTTLSVEITNVKKGSGKLWIGIYKPNEKFGGDKPGIYKLIEVKSAGNQNATFEVEPGRYALAVYHDLNNNNEMDKNLVGIPKEPYGFSKDFRPKFSAPSFSDCAFDVPAAGQKISVKITN
jgi:uncharacterized protein (DUF2141 family)